MTPRTSTRGGSHAPSSAQGGSSAIRIGVVALVVLAVAIAVISLNAPDRRPFDIGSTAVDGFAAVRILLEHRDVDVSEIRADDPKILGLGSGSVLVVPAPELASSRELESFVAAAERGATVVLGSRPEDSSSNLPDAPIFEEGNRVPTKRQLADTPFSGQRTDFCDIPELADLGAIDIAFSSDSLGTDALSFIPRPARTAPEQSCYGPPQAAEFRSVAVADTEAEVPDVKGRVVVMSSPYLWVNARLQPAKESGGVVPDNAATAVRLLHRVVDGRADEVIFVKALRTTSTTAAGTKSPVELLPFGVKLALVQLLVAFVLFVWWRSRRLGVAMVEPLPVEVAGSELVAAVGRLRYRHNDTNRAAAVLRSNMRRALGLGLGVPPTASFEVLVAAVAARTGRAPEQVHQILATGPVNDRDSLVKLSNDLESLKMECQDVHSR